MAKIPKLPKGVKKWATEDRTPSALRQEGHDHTVDSRGVYDLAMLSEERARFWLALDGWTLREATQLLCALDPEKIVRLESPPGGAAWLSTLGWPEHYDDLLFAMTRARDSNALSFPAGPLDVLKWARAKNVPMPVEFLARVQAFPVSAPAPRGPLLRAASHRRNILDALISLGFDPMALPAAAPGRESKAKAAARTALVPATMTADNFKRGWQELRTDEQIREA